MDLPFSLRFLKKIELFQVLKKLDKQFKRQLEINNGTVPLWMGEKKFLYWSYLQHKHLGSPIMIDAIRSKKSYFLKQFEHRGAEMEEKRNKLLKINSDRLEKNYSKILKTLNLSHEYIEIQAANIGNMKTSFGFTAKEIDALGVRPIFGNLVSRGYAVYYPNTQEEFNHFSGGNNNSVGEAIYKDVVSDQSNCEGIIITSDGLLMGELISELYSIRMSIKKSLYNKLTGSKCELMINNFWWGLYQSLIIISYLALFLVCYLIIREFIQELYYLILPSI
ncbi:MAG: hypothetical protein WCV73_03680 [Patescibacteria group bacterium]|jgi:hypothetical protein